MRVLHESTSCERPLNARQNKIRVVFWIIGTRSWASEDVREGLVTEVDRVREWRAKHATHGLDRMSSTFDFDGDGEPHGGSKWPLGIYKTPPESPDLGRLTTRISTARLIAAPCLPR